VDLTSTTVVRLRAILTTKISELTSSISENNLTHPTSALVSIADAVPEIDFVVTFKLEIVALFEKRAHSAFVIKLVSEKPSLLAIYLPILLAKAGSSDFATANAFSNVAESLDAPLSNLLSDNSAFELIVAIMQAAAWGAWSAKAIASAKFAGTPLLRAKVRSYIQANDATAASYIQKILADNKPMADFVAAYLTDEGST
jgi:hypothetical protein